MATIMRWLVAAAVLAACSGRHLDQPRPLVTRLVVGTAYYLSVYSWQETPWARPSDAAATDYPVYVIIASDWSACRVTAAEWTLAMTQDTYACERWLQPRYVRN